METLEQIDRYLDRALLPEESIGLELNLQADPDLQDLFDRVVVAREAVRSGALRNQVKSWHTQFLDEIRQEEAIEALESETDTTIVRPLWRGYGQSIRWGARVAASGILLLAGIASYQYATTTVDSYYRDKLMAYHLPAMRGVDEKLSTIDELYAAGNFTAITQRYKELVKQTPRDQFLTGMAHLQLDEYQQAIKQFTRIRQENVKRNTAYFEEETDYYLALAYLGDGHISDAYPLFEKIKDTPKHIYHQNVTDGDLWKLSLLRWKSN